MAGLELETKVLLEVTVTAVPIQIFVLLRQKLRNKAKRLKSGPFPASFYLFSSFQYS